MTRCPKWTLQLWITLHEVTAEGKSSWWAPKACSWPHLFRRQQCAVLQFLQSLRVSVHQSAHASAWPCLWTTLFQAMSHDSSFSVHLAAQSFVTGFKSFDVYWSGLYSDVTVISLGAIKSHFPFHIFYTQNSEWSVCGVAGFLEGIHAFCCLRWTQFFRTLGFAAGSLIITRPQCLVKKGWTHGPCRTSRDFR